MHRADPITGIEKNTLQYSRTIDLLRIYEDVLNPLDLFWPEYDSEGLMLYDLSLYVQVPEDKFYRIKENIVSNIQHSNNARKPKIWAKLADKIASKHTEDVSPELEQYVASVKSITFNRDKFNMTDYKRIDATKLYELVSQNLGVYEGLVRRLNLKYLITTKLAKIWIDEYCRFM